MARTTRTRRQTVHDLFPPPSTALQTLRGKWAEDAASILLGFVWKGYDLMRAELLDRFDVTQAEENLERSISQLLQPRIAQKMTGDEPFYVQHGPYENESRAGGNAQPPQYDIAFVFRQNEAVMWPLEAETLKTDGSVLEYAKGVRLNFLRCRYAPFVAEGAMLGYLFSGKADTAFKNIAAELSCVLVHNRNFASRAHKVSRHRRIVPKGKTYPVNFSCHHLILIMQPRHPALKFSPRGDVADATAHPAWMLVPDSAPREPRRRGARIACLVAPRETRVRRARRGRDSRPGRTPRA